MKCLLNLVVSGDLVVSGVLIGWCSVEKCPLHWWLLVEKAPLHWWSVEGDENNVTYLHAATFLLRFTQK